ncbi:MAG: hypothetical protein KatS3mg110_4482 [Pirellulaceae bacterium]|nr:MAG: hypothetical protein KatS3mg110_4482 [Pirellulaceae bacterium]
MLQALHFGRKEFGPRANPPGTRILSASSSLLLPRRGEVFFGRQGYGTLTSILEKDPAEFLVAL